jgi:hypothetical protein
VNGTYLTGKSTSISLSRWRERAGVAYMDVGKGREQERKLEGSSLSIAASTFPLILAFSPGRRDFQPYLV